MQPANGVVIMDFPAHKLAKLRQTVGGGRAMMVKRILWGVAIAVVGVFFYLGYHTYDAGRTLSSGDVQNGDSSRVSDKSKTDAASAAQPANQTIVYPAANQPGGTIMSAPKEPNSTEAQIAQPGISTAAATPPPADSIDPNPPNGMRFSGSGRYQLYRQGNITWRLDTNTGSSCIIFATDEEWKKPRVRHDACPRK